MRLKSEDIKLVGVQVVGRHRRRLLGVLRGGRRQGLAAGEAAPEVGKEGRIQANRSRSVWLGQLGGGKRTTVPTLNTRHMVGST